MRVTIKTLRAGWFSLKMLFLSMIPIAFMAPKLIKIAAQRLTTHIRLYQRP